MGQLSLTPELMKKVWWSPIRMLVPAVRLSKSFSFFKRSDKDEHVVLAAPVALWSSACDCTGEVQILYFECFVVTSGH